MFYGFPDTLFPVSWAALLSKVPLQTSVSFRGGFSVNSVGMKKDLKSWFFIDNVSRSFASSPV